MLFLTTAPGMTITSRSPRHHPSHAFAGVGTRVRAGRCAHGGCSGTLWRELSAISASSDGEDKLIAANGAYGHGEWRRLPPRGSGSAPLYEQDNHKRPPGGRWWQQLTKRHSHHPVSMVHGETTSGISDDVGGCGPGGKGRRQHFTCGTPCPPFAAA